MQPQKKENEAHVRYGDSVRNEKLGVLFEMNGAVGKQNQE